MEGVALQTVVGQLLLEHGNGLLRHRLAHKGDGELLFHFVRAALDQLGVGKDKLAFQVTLYVAVHDGIMHRHAADEDAGDHRDDGDGQNDAVDFFLPLGADLPVGRYSQQYRHQRGGQGDKQGVDGKEVEPVKLLDSVMGVELSEGEHNVVFKYRTPGLVVGIGISCLSVIVFVYMIYRNRNKNLNI